MTHNSWPVSFALQMVVYKRTQPHTVQQPTRKHIQRYMQTHTHWSLLITTISVCSAPWLFSFYFHFKDQQLPATDLKCGQMCLCICECVCVCVLCWTLPLPFPAINFVCVCVRVYVCVCVCVETLWWKMIHCITVTLAFWVASLSGTIWRTSLYYWKTHTHIYFILVITLEAWTWVPHISNLLDSHTHPNMELNCDTNTWILHSHMGCEAQLFEGHKLGWQMFLTECRICGKWLLHLNVWVMCKWRYINMAFHSTGLRLFPASQVCLMDYSEDQVWVRHGFQELSTWIIIVFLLKMGQKGPTPLVPVKVLTLSFTLCV